MVSLACYRTSIYRGIPENRYDHFKDLNQLMFSEEHVADFFIPYTTAILRHHKQDSVEFFGSSLLINHLGRYYLISAAHVLDHLNNEPPLFINVPGGLLTLSGEICTTASMDLIARRDDRLDISVLALPESQNHILKAAPSVTLEELDSKQEIHKEHGFIVAGYPVTKNKNSVDRIEKLITPSAYIGICQEAKSDIYAQLGSHKSLSLALKFNRKEVFSIDGRKRTAPALNGLSGAPVWGFTKDGIARVAGILIEHYQGTKKCIVATRALCIIPPIKLLSERDQQLSKGA